MLKMTIDNEEVVSDKDITINEEMLSASSTILNNVYPKEWEEDKDYTSRFYYPQDYSKALIQRSYVTQEAEAGTTIQVNGSVTLTDVDTTKQSRVLRLLGQTSQSGTPTPSSPIPVNVVSGDNEINICGKNICDIVLDSTVTGDITYKTYSLQPNTQYTVSTNTWVTSSSTANIFASAGTSFSPSSATNGVNVSRTITSDSNGNITIGYRNVNLSLDYSSGNYYVQLEKGSSATTYEPYIGNTYNIDLPVENLLPTDSNAWEQGSIVGGSDSASTTRIRTIDYYSIKKDTNYYVSINNSNYCFLNIMLYDNSKTYIGQYYDIDSSINGTRALLINVPISNVAYMRVTIRNTDNTSAITSSEITTIKPQIELGSKQNAFTLYGTTPIELCKIGTYQDYIYKDDDKWYLYKAIGKYTFTGNESVTLSQTPNVFYINNSYDNALIDDTSTPLCTIFQGAVARVNASTVGNNANNSVCLDKGTNKRFYFKTDVYSTGSDLATGLAGQSIYWIYETPATTQITYTPLIEQLNALTSE